MPPSIIIQNLNCGGYPKTIEPKLWDLENIADLMVDVEKLTVSFESENENDAKAVKGKMSDLHYPYTDDKNSVAAKAMACDSCDTGKNSNK